MIIIKYIIAIIFTLIWSTFTVILACSFIGIFVILIDDPDSNKSYWFKIYEDAIKKLIY